MNSKCVCHTINLGFQVFSDYFLNLFQYQIFCHENLLRKIFQGFNTRNKVLLFVKNNMKVRKITMILGSKKLYESAKVVDPVALKQGIAWKTWGSCCKASLGRLPSPVSGDDVTGVIRILSCFLVPNVLVVTVTDEM